MRPLVEQVLALYAQNKSMEVVLSLSLLSHRQAGSPAAKC
jgi:hypothetical protein